MQTRQMESNHIDTKDGYMCLNYLIGFYVMHQEKTKLLFVNDKVVILVGVPENVGSTNTH